MFSFICSCFVLTGTSPGVKPLALREDRSRSRDAAVDSPGMVRQAATRVCASQGGGLGAMTEPLYEHGNFADLIGYRLTAWPETRAMPLSLNTQYIGPRA